MRRIAIVGGNKGIGNAIAPTITDTQLASKLLRNEKMIENITNRHPLKKFLNPEEVANIAAF